MKNKNILKIVALAILPLLLLTILLLGIFYLTFLRIDAVLYVIIALGALAFILIAIYVCIALRKTFKGEIVGYNKVENIKEKIDMKLEGQSSLVITKDKNIQPMVNSLNNLLSDNYQFSGNVLYEYGDFKELVKLSLRKANSGVLVRFLDKHMLDIDRKAYMDELRDGYFGKGRYSLDYFVTDYGNKKYIFDKVDEFLKGKKLRAIIVFYPEIAADDLFFASYPYYSSNKKVSVVESDNLSIDGILSLMYRNESKEDPLNALSNLLYGYIALSPYSHILTLVDDKVLKGARIKGVHYYEDYNKEDFSHFEDIDLMVSDSHKVHMLFLSIDPIDDSITKDILLKRNLIIHAVKKLILYYLLALDHKENIQIKDDILELTNSYYYRANKNMEIVEVSDNLARKSKESLIGKNLFNALYGIKKFKDLELTAEQRENVIIPLIGSETFSQVVKEHNEYYDVYLLAGKLPEVQSYAIFKDKLLSDLAFNKRGYLLAFRINLLENAARKYKTNVEEIIKKIYGMLHDYGMLANLYRKSEDEFVYLLEGSGREGAYFLAERLSRAFNEQFETEDEKGISLSIKVIALSYPLEVSTLFEFESLCRTLFRQAEKKGKLYRLEEEPRNVDRNHEYVELLDSSFQNANIPHLFIDVVDKNEKPQYQVVKLNYVDDKGEAIRDDDMTLVAKKAHFYSSLVERSIKQFDFENNKRYIINLSREGLNEETFNAIETMFEVKRAKKNQVIFEIREKDIKNNMKDFEKLIERGFKFALSSIDTYVKNTKVENFEYVRLEAKRYNKDMFYTVKLTELINNNLKVLVKESEKELVQHDLIEK